MRNIGQVSYSELLVILRSKDITKFSDIDFIEKISKEQTYLSDTNKSEIIKLWFKEIKKERTIHCDIDNLQKLVENIGDSRFKKHVIKDWIKKTREGKSCKGASVKLLCGLVDTEEDKKSVVKSWFNHSTEGRSILRDLGFDELTNKSEIDLSFLQGSAKDSNIDLKTARKIIVIGQSVRSPLKSKDRNISGLILAIEKLTKNESKKTEIKTWFKKSDFGKASTKDDLIQILDCIKGESQSETDNYKEAIISSWIENTEYGKKLSHDDLLLLLQTITHSHYRPSLIKTWLKSSDTDSECSFVQLVDLLNLIKGNPSAKLSDVIELWRDNYPQGKEFLSQDLDWQKEQIRNIDDFGIRITFLPLIGYQNLSLNDLEILLLCQKEERKSKTINQIIDSWIVAGNNCQKITPEDISNIDDEDFKLHFLTVFVKMVDLDVHQISGFMESLSIFQQKKIISIWLKTQKGHEFNPVEFQHIDIDLLEEITRAWAIDVHSGRKFAFDREVFSKIESDDVRTMLAKLLIIRDWNKQEDKKISSLVKNSNSLSLIQDPKNRKFICALILLKSGFILNERSIELLQEQDLSADLVTGYLKESARSKEQNPSINIEKFKELLEILNPVDNNNFISKEVVSQWVNAHQTENEIYSALKLVLDEELITNKYKYGDVLDILFSVYKPPLYKLKIFDIARDIYPNNQRLQAEFIVDAIINKDLENREHIDQIKDFIAEISDHDSVLMLVDALRKNYDLSEGELLNLCSGRIKSQYGAISNLLAIGIDGNIKGESIAQLETIFSKKELESKSLGDLFSYFEINGKVNEFVAMLEDNFLAILREKFILPENILYIRKSEYDNLLVLVPDAEKTMFSTEVLCDVIKDSIPPLPILTPNDLESFKINFPDIYPPEESKIPPLPQNLKNELSSEFVELFNDESPDPDRVATFILSVGRGTVGDASELKPDNVKKLFDFFMCNKNLIAHFLSQPGSVTDLNYTIFGISDGCVANFADQFQAVAIKSLIKDPTLRTLFSFFSEKIKSKIFGGTEDHIGGSPEGADVFNNKSITSTFIHQENLIQHILNYVSTDRNITQEVIKYKFIQFGFSANEEADNSAREKMGELLGEMGEKKSNNMVNYLVLERLAEKIPDLLKGSIFEGCDVEINKYFSSQQVSDSGVVQGLALTSATQLSPSRVNEKQEASI